jgi:hypothetical protein
MRPVDLAYLSCQLSSPSQTGLMANVSVLVGVDSAGIVKDCAPTRSAVSAQAMAAEMASVVSHGNVHDVRASVGTTWEFCVLTSTSGYYIVCIH